MCVGAIKEERTLLNYTVRVGVRTPSKNRNHADKFCEEFTTLNALSRPTFVCRRRRRRQRGRRACAVSVSRPFKSARESLCVCVSRAIIELCHRM